MRNTFLYAAAILIISLASGCNYESNFTIDEKPMVKMDKRFLGDWKVTGDPDKKNFFRVKYYDVPNQYHMLVCDRGGTNFTYEFNFFFSEVGGAQFINIMNWKAEGWPGNEKYILLKVIKISPEYDKITALCVSDPGLLAAKNSKEVRMRIAMNVNVPSYYASDTVYINKVK